MVTQIVVPTLGESIVEATVTRWLKKVGDTVAAGDVLLELETEKVNLEVGSEHAGMLTKILRKEGDDVRIGDVLGEIEESAGAAAPHEAESTPELLDEEEAFKTAAPTPPEQETDLAKEMIGPGKPAVAEGGGIADEETPRKAPAEPQRMEPADQKLFRPVEHEAAPAIKPAEAEVPERAGRVERVKMSRRRRTIARNLVEAQHTAAILTTFNEIDMDAVMRIRKRHKEPFKERHGVSLGITSFFVKAVIGALKEFPELNAEIDGEEVVLKHYYDIGVALDTSEGLIVPVLREADGMSFAEIEQAIETYIRKTKEGTLSMEDLRGGCFTITNGGVFGSLLSTPILNLPQVGILGLHRIEERPIALGGQVVIHPMMYVALSYDHRIIDGREAVQFLKRIKELIEDPGSLLLEI